MDSVKVGKPFVPGVLKWPPDMQYIYSKNGHEIRVFLPGLTKIEIQALKKTPIELGVFSVDEAFLMLYQIQDLCEWSTMPFNWFAIPEPFRRTPEIGKEPTELMLTVVDGDNGIVRVRRALKMSPQFADAIATVVQKQIDTGDTWMKAKLNDIHDKYFTPSDMVADAVMVETIDDDTEAQNKE